MNQIFHAAVAFGANLSDRVKPEEIEVALEYFQHGEGGVAIELLIGYIVEADATISEAELSEALRLAEAVNVKVGSKTLAYIKKNMSRTY